MKRILIGSLLLIIALTLYAKQDAGSFRLIHADKMYLNNLPSGQILDLAGKVHFFYGDTEFKSDRALILDGPKIARLSGRVSVQSDTLHLAADSLAYYRIPEVLNLGGKVKLTQSTAEGKTRWMKGDYGIYDLAKDTFSTWSRVSAFDEAENATASCGYAFWDRAAGYSYLIEEPYLKVAQKDSISIRADKMEYYEEDKKLVATFNVRVESTDFNATSDFLLFFTTEEKAVFVGEPMFFNDFTTATAEEFHLWFEGRELIQASLVDSCTVYFAEEAEGEKESWVKAQNIQLYFAERQITNFDADTEVSYYFLQEEKDKKDFFINAAQGQVLKAIFDSDNKIKLLDMQGSIRGRYIFKNDS